MVETSLFPRPQFATFLRSDDGVDPLSYYHYQRLQRMQKVARLQERRSKSHEPGYKKTALASIQTSQLRAPQLHSGGSDVEKSRQIFAKPPGLRQDAATGSPAGDSSGRQELRSALAATSKTGIFAGEKRVSVSLDAAKPGLVEGAGGRKGETAPKHSQTERLSQPAVRRFSKPAKSATTQGSHLPPLLVKICVNSIIANFFVMQAYVLCQVKLHFLCDPRRQDLQLEMWGHSQP